MSLKDKLSDVWNRKFRRRRDTDEYDDESYDASDDNGTESYEVNRNSKADDDPSYDGADYDSPDDEITFPEDEEDETTQAKKLRRKHIMLAGGAVVFIAAGAMAYSAFNSPTLTPEEKEQALSQNTASNAHNPAKDLPTKYSDISKYQKTQESQGKANGMNGPQTQNQVKPAQTTYHPAPAANTTVSSNASGRINTARPAATTYTPASSSSSGRPAVSVSSTPSPAEKASEEAKKAETEAMNSSIAFKIAAAVTQAVTGTSPVQASTSPVAVTAPAPAYLESEPSTGHEYTLNAGSVIQATLFTAINSDSPDGDVIAQVRENVYDSLTGTHLLIPQGSRLIGTYGQAGSRGNNRIGVVFTRIILPDGASIDLPDQKAVDASGMQGLADKYTQHSSSLFKTAFMTALIGAAAQSATGNTSGNDTRSPGQEAVSGAVSQILDTANELLKRNSDVQPTIQISQGFPFSVFINQDLLIREYDG